MSLALSIQSSYRRLVTLGINLVLIVEIFKSASNFSLSFRLLHFTKKGKGKNLQLLTWKNKVFPQIYVTDHRVQIHNKN